MAKCEKCGNPWPYHDPGSTTCLEIQIDGLQQRLEKAEAALVVAEARAVAAESVQDVALKQIGAEGRLRGMAEAKVDQLTRYIAKSCSPKCVPGRNHLCDDCPINSGLFAVPGSKPFVIEVTDISVVDGKPVCPPSVDHLAHGDRPETNGKVTFRYGPLSSRRR